MPAAAILTRVRMAIRDQMAGTRRYSVSKLRNGEASVQQ